MKLSSPAWTPLSWSSCSSSARYIWSLNAVTSWKMTLIHRALNDAQAQRHVGVRGIFLDLLFELLV